jgi:PilZ domain-containing protein
MPVQERRKLARSRVLKGAKIVLGNSSVIDCAVRNVTNSGARVQIANTVDLPNGLDLTFDGGRSLRPCRVVWRSVTETGVEFIVASK